MVDQRGYVQAPDEIKVVVIFNVLAIEDLARGIDFGNETCDILGICQPVMPTSEQGGGHIQCSQVVLWRESLQNKR